jgi:hypothetical protein
MQPQELFNVLVMEDQREPTLSDTVCYDRGVRLEILPEEVKLGA